MPDTMVSTLSVAGPLGARLLPPSGRKQAMAGQGRWRSSLPPGVAERILEPVLALLLAGLVLIGQVQVSGANHGAMWLDLAACVTSALGALRSREGPWVFFVVLLSYVAIPQNWVTLGELAMLIPVLGMGIRGQKQMRRILSPLMLAVVVYRSVLNEPFQRAWIYFGFWMVAVAAAWLVGDAFTRSRAAQRQAAEMALLGQRTQIARDLHDVVAHDLSNVALRAQQALMLGTGDPDDLHFIAHTASKCVDDMRHLLRLLRDVDGASRAPGRWREPDVSATVDEQVERLRTAGFKVSAQIEGSLEDLRGTVPHAVSWILVEACNNVLRHGNPAQPCAILLTNNSSTLDLAVINSASGMHAVQRPGRLGIVGMRERAIAAGGSLDVRQHVEKWIVNATFPKGRLNEAGGGG